MSNNRFWSKAILSIIVTGAFTVVTACSLPATPAGDGPGKTPGSTPPTAKAPAAKPAAKDNPKPAAPKAAAKAAEKPGDQLVVNFNFTDWEKEGPRRWIADPAAKVAKSTDSAQKGASVELKPSGTDKFTMLRQYLTENIAGKTITLTLRAKPEEDNVLAAKLTYATQAGPQTVAVEAGSVGKWGTVTKTVKIPADVKPDSVMLAVLLRPEAKKSALVDFVTVAAK